MTLAPTRSSAAGRCREAPRAARAMARLARMAGASSSMPARDSDTPTPTISSR